MNSCSHCLDDFKHLPYQFAILDKNGSTVEIREAFCCFVCMKFWFEDERIEDWKEMR